MNGPERRTVRHGPFAGYNSAIDKEHIGDHEISGDSRDWRLNPNRNCWVGRNGSAILAGDSVSAPVGLLERNYGARCRQISEFPAMLDDSGVQQFTAGQPSYSALFDDGVNEGQDWFWSTNGSGTKQVPGKSFSANTYPTTGRSGVASYFKALAFWREESNGSGTHRCTTAAHRSKMTAGSRRALDVGRWRCYGSLYGVPTRWNRLFNDSSTVPTRKERHTLLGLLPPLFPARFKLTDLPAASATPTNWKGGDSFYVSMCWIFEDGTWSTPFTPRKLKADPPAGMFCNRYGRVTLPVPATGVGDQYYDTVPFRNIPRGPNGTVGRAMLRSPKVNVAVLTTAIPNDQDLRIMHIIWDNSTTSYDSPDGDDNALEPDDVRIRSDRILAPRGRHISSCQGRVFMGYTKRNPALIVLAPTSTFEAAAPYTDGNNITDDDDAVLGGTAYGVRVDANQLALLRSVGPWTPGTVTTQTISIVNKTAQEVVDLINSTADPNGGGGEWRAQLAPGANPNELCGAASGLVSNIDQGSGTDAYGDDALFTGATPNVQQAISQAYPAVLYLKNSVLSALYPNADKDRSYFTGAAAPSAAKGVDAAPNNWLVGNTRRPDRASGVLQGFAALDIGMVHLYADKIWILKNTRDFRSGADEDFYLELVSNHGCIAWDSIVEGDGWFGWLSPNGYMVSAGRWGDEQCISGKIFDVSGDSGPAGDLAYEIAQCQASAAADTDNQRFHAKVIGKTLEIRYRSSSDHAVPDAAHVYDFSEGQVQGGLASLFRGVGPDGKGVPYGWSARYRLPGECIGFYRSANGPVKIHAIETTGSTGDGRLDRFDVGYQDNGATITCDGFTKMDDQGENRRRKRDRKTSYEYSSPDGHAFVIRHSRDRFRASSTEYVLDTTGSLEVSKQTKRIKLDGQSLARVHEYEFSVARVSSTPPTLWSIEREVDLADTIEESAG